MKPGIIVLLFKIGPKIFAAFVKLAPKLTSGKIILAGASFASYSFLFSWKFALLLMVALSIHESGHVFAMRQHGIKTKGFYFIPFIGGAAVAEEAFPSRSVEAYVALMGPVWGFFTAVAPAIVYWFTGNPLFAAAAGWIAMFNLFNLLPISPLDGGRVAKSLAFSVGTGTTSGYIFLGIGIVLCFALAVFTKMVLFAIILVAGTFELISEFRARKKIRKIFRKIPPREKLLEQKRQIDEIIYKQMILSPSSPEENYQKLSEGFHEAKLNVEKYLKDWEIFEKRFGGMPRNNVIHTIVAYLGLIAVLFALMHAMSHVPAADIALQFLKE